ncbi:MAG: transcriptional regulator [Rhodobacteraceae bacterium]|nr:transcriptional regulator [Paracoccaceae bacterium]
MSRHIKLDQIDAEEQLLVRLAWACEIEGMTQADAAVRFGVTRLRVNKALNEARRRGILRVSVNSVFSAAAELEWELERRFRLLRSVVVPSPADQAPVTPLVSAGLGAHLGHILANEGLTKFGMSWGNTLNLATRFMQPINRPDLEIVSIMGGVSRGSDVNGYEVTTRLADLCNAEHSFFTAPLYASSPESQALFLEQDVIREMLEKIRSCGAIALATGDLESSLLVRDALPRDVDRVDLIAKGGVGDITGHILDAQGELIEHDINRRVIGVSLDDMTKIDNVILAAGGLHKVPILAAALRRGFVDTLVTDENTAVALLKYVDA